jgi:hypothetical protein
MLMKEEFTIREIMDGTGLTRQRVHQLIKGHGIQVRKKGNRFLLTWNDLVNMADSPTILHYLRDFLRYEWKGIKRAYEELQQDERAIKFARAIMHARALVEGHPDISARYDEGWEEWDKAVSFFSNLSTVRNPSMEE